MWQRPPYLFPSWILNNVSIWPKKKRRRRTKSWDRYSKVEDFCRGFRYLWSCQDMRWCQEVSWQVPWVNCRVNWCSLYIWRKLVLELCISKKKKSGQRQWSQVTHWPSLLRSGGLSQQIWLHKPKQFRRLTSVPAKSICIWLTTARAWTCPLGPSKDCCVDVRVFQAWNINPLC